MTNKRGEIKGEHNITYNLEIWKKNYVFDILKDISVYVTLVQLVHSLGNFNRAISIVGHWIFYSDYKKELSLTQ